MLFFGAVHRADGWVKPREIQREGKREKERERRRCVCVRWKWHRSPLFPSVSSARSLVTSSFSSQPSPLLHLSAHQNLPSPPPPPPTTSYRSLSLSPLLHSLSSGTSFSLPQSKNIHLAPSPPAPIPRPHPTPFCSVIQSWRQSAEGWVMMFCRKIYGTWPAPLNLSSLSVLFLSAFFNIFIHMCLKWAARRRTLIYKWDISSAFTSTKQTNRSLKCRLSKCINSSFDAVVLLSLCCLTE